MNRIGPDNNSTDGIHRRHPRERKLPKAAQGELDCVDSGKQAGLPQVSGDVEPAPVNDQAVMANRGIHVLTRMDVVTQTMANDPNAQRVASRVQMIDRIATLMAQRTGLSPEQALAAIARELT